MKKTKPAARSALQEALAKVVTPSMDFFANELLHGRTIQFRPKGNSMSPKIKSGQLVTVSPDISELKDNEIVFCRVNGTFYVHIIKAIQGDRYLIGNNKGGINGWTTKILGRITKVEP